MLVGTTVIVTCSHKCMALATIFVQSISFTDCLGNCNLGKNYGSRVHATVDGMDFWIHGEPSPFDPKCGMAAPTQVPWSRIAPLDSNIH